MNSVRVQCVLYFNPVDQLRRWLKSVELSILHAGCSSTIYIGVNSANDHLVSSYRELIETDFPNLDVYLCPIVDNIGHGAMHNKLFSLGNLSDFLLICNPDGYLDFNAVSLFLSASGGVEYPVAFDARQIPFDHPKIFNFDTLDCEWLSGACLFLSSKDFEKIAGFDERFFLQCDDIDLSLRLKVNGVQIKHLPIAKFYHSKTASPEGFMKPSKDEKYYNKLGSLLLADKWCLREGLEEMLRELNFDPGDLSQSVLNQFEILKGDYAKVPCGFVGTLKYMGAWKFSTTFY
jgi:hypothetical protein